MADRTSLGFLGFIFGGVTAIVVLLAFAVVINNLDGHFALEAAEAAPAPIAATR